MEVMQLALGVQGKALSYDADSDKGLLSPFLSRPSLWPMTHKF